MDDLNTFEQQLQREVHRAFGPPRPVDVAAIVRTAATSTAASTTSRQRSRWWPLPSFRRSAQAPTVTGRTKSMFSPAKAIAAGALVFAVGGVLFIAQPFEPRGSVPGAETEAAAPTWVTGSIRPAPSCTSGEVEYDGDVRRDRNVECSPQTWTSSDPRLTGAVSRRWNVDIHRMGEGPISVGMDAAYLRNDGGGWACSSGYLEHGTDVTAVPVTGTTFTCIGSGGYEGLSAVLVSEAGADINWEEFVGLIFSGDLPPLPDPPAAE